MLELINLERTGGISGQCYRDGDGSAATDNVLGVEDLGALRRTAPVGGANSAGVGVAFVIADGSDGDGLVAPLTADNGELTRGAGNGKNLGDGDEPDAR